MIDEKSPLNILFLASWYPNRLEPQNGNFIQRHAQAVAQKAKVAVLHVISSPELRNIEITKEWNGNLYEVIVYFPKSPAWNPIAKMNKYLNAHRQGFELVLEELGHIDITHLNVFFRAGLFALELNKKYGIPYIVTEHLTAFLDSNPYEFKWYEKYFIKKIAKAAALICPVSEDLRDALIRFGVKGPFEVVPNVVDTNLFQNEKQRQYEKIKLLHVSTLSEDHKNFSGMLRVIKRLSEIRTDFDMSFVGNNFGESSIQKAKAMGLWNTFVTIQEEIPIESIAQLMQAHHIFVLFSNYENLPCVISEAHASGMLVVATDVGGVREMINPNNGFLIKARDETALLQNLIQAMDNIQSFDTAKIRSEAVNRYSYEQVGQGFRNIYQTILANK